MTRGLRRCDLARKSRRATHERPDTARTRTPPPTLTVNFALLLAALERRSLVLVGVGDDAFDVEARLLDLGSAIQALVAVGGQAEAEQAPRCWDRSSVTPQEL